MVRIIYESSEIPTKLLEDTWLLYTLFNVSFIADLYGVWYISRISFFLETTNYDELLALCQEYQMDWLTDIIQKYLVDAKHFKEDNILDGLFLADKYNLDILREGICSKVYSLKKLYQNERFQLLSRSSKYQLVRTIIQREVKNEKVTNLLDSCF